MGGVGVAARVDGGRGVPGSCLLHSLLVAPFAVRAHRVIPGSSERRGGIRVTRFGGPERKRVFVCRHPRSCPESHDVGVTGYNVYRNGVKIATASDTQYADATVAPNATYQYTVSAYDGSGNTSAQTPTVSVTVPGNATPRSSPTVGSPGASQLPAPTDPGVTVSRHRALLTSRQYARTHFQWANRPGSRSCSPVHHRLNRL